MSGGMGREEGGENGGQGVQGPREDYEKQGEGAEGLLGVRNIARTSHGSSVSNHPLVWEQTQTGMSGACGVENSTVGVLQEAKLEKGLRGFRAIALMSVLAKWYAAVGVALLQGERELLEWKELHVGAERKKTLRKGVGSCWRDGHIYRAKNASLAKNVTGWSARYLVQV